MVWGWYGMGQSTWFGEGAGGKHAVLLRERQTSPSLPNPCSHGEWQPSVVGLHVEPCWPRMTRPGRPTSLARPTGHRQLATKLLSHTLHGRPALCTRCPIHSGPQPTPLPPPGSWPPWTAPPRQTPARCPPPAPCCRPGAPPPGVGRSSSAAAPTPAAWCGGVARPCCAPRTCSASPR